MRGMLDTSFSIHINDEFDPLASFSSIWKVSFPHYAFGMNYCEIRCKYDDDFNTAHVMIHQNWSDSFNYQMIQSVNVLKDMIDVRDCVKESAILNMNDVMYIINDICLNKIPPF